MERVLPELVEVGRGSGVELLYGGHGGARSSAMGLHAGQLGEKKGTSFC